MDVRLMDVRCRMSDFRDVGIALNGRPNSRNPTSDIRHPFRRHPFPRITVLAILCLGVLMAQKYSGPRPPKPDIPYLVHADELVTTDVSEAKEEKRKEDLAYVVAGASSSAKTPLAGPVFILLADKIAADKLQLYRFDVKNGRREVFFSHKGKGSARARRLNVKALDGGLFRIEVDESLENGEYALTPEGSNQVFCFQVY